jgi:hypothetical protein
MDLYTHDITIRTTDMNYVANYVLTPEVRAELTRVADNLRTLTGTTQKFGVAIPVLHTWDGDKIGTLDFQL